MTYEKKNGLHAAHAKIRSSNTNELCFDLFMNQYFVKFLVFTNKVCKRSLDSAEKYNLMFHQSFYTLEIKHFWTKNMKLRFEQKN